MSAEDLYNEIIDDVRDLLAQPGVARRGKLRLSPELAEQLGMLADPCADATTLGDLAEVVAGCTRCELHETRTQTVFGNGSATADLMFVGEAPGQTEDERGEVFCGKAGQLLTSIIEKGFELSRDEVYICNVLKCRPPENRDPRPDERTACIGYLKRQIELIQPKVICALGKHGAQILTGSEEGINRLRGTWYWYHGIPVRATFHPAYLLRNEADKKKAWADVKIITKLLNGEITVTPDA